MDQRCSRSAYWKCLVMEGRCRAAVYKLSLYIAPACWRPLGRRYCTALPEWRIHAFCFDIPNLQMYFGLHASGYSGIFRRFLKSVDSSLKKDCSVSC